MSDAEEEELYDEFGNYIGPDLDSSSDEDDDDDNLNAPNGDGDDDASDVSDEDDDNRNNNNIQDTGEGQLVPHDGATSITTANPESAIVLHEDKEHYPSAEQVFGEDVRAAVLDEDAMDIDVPLVQPLNTKTIFNKKSAAGTVTNDLTDKDKDSNVFLFDDSYLTLQLSNETTQVRRGCCVVGHFHHGKTSFVDLCLEPTFAANGKGQHDNRHKLFTDLLQTERDRQMSTTSTPLTSLFPDARGKNYALTLLDCPGHVQFHDETVAAVAATDGALLVVDVVEGVMMHTEMVIREVVRAGIPLVLVLNKVDRLICECKLPPNDAYYKLQHCLDSVNELVQQVSQGRYPLLNPAAGNVVFASALHGWMFTLESFANVYLEQQGAALGENLSVRDFAVRLWGDAFLDPKTGTFHKSAHACPTASAMPEDNDDEYEDNIPPTIHRTFVTLILEPLYKIYAACLAEPERDVNRLLRGLGVFLNKSQLRSSAQPLLKAAVSQFLASAHGGWVQACVKWIPSPKQAASAKLARCYTGPVPVLSKNKAAAPSVKPSRRVRAMMQCQPRGPLMIHAVKQYASSADGQSFLTLGRIYSGTVRPQTRVKILGEAYSPHDDEEDVSTATVEAVFIPRGPYRTEVTLAQAGNWVLLQGIDANIAKTATIVGIDDANNKWEDDDGDNEEDDMEDECHIFAPLKFPQAGGESVMKLAIEPLNPAELPKMVEGLRRVSKAYPMVQTKVEESGEHVVLGTGELYLDCVMHDLRQVYTSDVEVKAADPIVSFRESVVDTSSVKCFAETANKRNKLTFLAEPMEDGLAEVLEAGKLSKAATGEWDNKKVGRFFQSRYDWDLLSSRSIWAFGDSPTHGTNILLDDTLPSDIDKSLLNTCKSSIVQGFQWAMREGPLCEEPVRGTKLKLLDATLADKPIYRGGGQVIPTARRTVHSSLLTATPRLMEPVYKVQIQCSNSSIVDAIQPVLARRRGHVVQDVPVAGTTFFNIRGFLPVLDSFGFETDLRTFTQGQAMVSSVFDHWSIVPGDPLDQNIILHPLEPSPPHCLARELLIKTRRRKGLSEDVSITKFFDPAMRESLFAAESTGNNNADAIMEEQEQ